MQSKKKKKKLFFLKNYRKNLHEFSKKKQKQKKKKNVRSILLIHIFYIKNFSKKLPDNFSSKNNFYKIFNENK